MTKETGGNGSDEREFLHDLASPLGTAMFIIDSVMEDLQARPGVTPDDLTQIAQLSGALEKMKQLLSDRRQVLIQRGVPSARA